jgi:hypothetical protein
MRERQGRALRGGEQADGRTQTFFSNKENKQINFLIVEFMENNVLF